MIAQTDPTWIVVSPDSWGAGATLDAATTECARHYSRTPGRWQAFAVPVGTEYRVDDFSGQFSATAEPVQYLTRGTARGTWRAQPVTSDL